MNLVNEAKEVYERSGVSGVIIQSWRFMLLYSPIAERLNSILGDVLHEQLIRAPTIGYWPSIREPRSFNEKIMFRKILTDDDRFAFVEDKWAVRSYVADVVGDHILNDVLLVTDDPDDIPFEDLPEKFVIKSTHGSDWNVIVENKSSRCFEKIREQCDYWLSHRYPFTSKEYWYEDIPPRLLVERFIEDDARRVPLDFKFFVFGGEVEYIQVDYDRMSDHTRRLYDKNWRALDVTLRYPLGPTIEPPPNFESLIEIAETLGEGFDFIRVDLYNPREGEILFGEMTVAHGSGGEKFTPLRYDYEFGGHWDIETTSSNIETEGAEEPYLVRE